MFIVIDQIMFDQKGVIKQSDQVLDSQLTGCRLV